METTTTILSKELKQALAIAAKIAKENSHPLFTPGHLLKAMLHRELSLLKYLESLGKDVYFIEEWAEVRINAAAKSANVFESESDEAVEEVLEEAHNVMEELDKDEIDLICVFIAMCIPGIAFNYDQLKTFPVSHSEIISLIMNDLPEFSGGKSNQVSASTMKGKKLDNLNKYCVNKTELAAKGLLPSVTARGEEIKMVSEILCRLSKPNVLITGEPGVGKTAVVNGFIAEVQNGNVPPVLQQVVIYELDFGSLIAGASYKGEAEDRLKNVINEIKTHPKAILLIDNIHQVLDKNAGHSGAGQLLKSALGKGEITLIGITTLEEYRKNVEKDEAFNRQFEIVRIEEPNDENNFRILKHQAPLLTKHHELDITDKTLKEVIDFSKRYLKEKSLPDSAIDLADRSMAVVKTMSDTAPGEIERLLNDLDEIEKDAEAPEEDKIRKIQWLAADANQKLGHLLLVVTEEPISIEIDDLKKSIECLKNRLNILQEKVKITKKTIDQKDIAAVISKITGIPIGKLESKEREKLLNIEDILRKRVVGQDHAIATVSEAVLESRSGLSKAGQPMGSFFFLGPTGTGKTELAKSLAEFLFQDESAIIRFDMSEFKEEHSAALLYGAPPGYVGYEEGGLLVNKIRQKPYSIVLFDEIEKAHTSVFDVFLQIMDEGKLHDRLGKEGDFSNALILFTSNIGSDFIVDSFTKGEIPKSNDLLEKMSRHFRPEFLGRLTEVVPFAPISEDNARKIFDIHLKNELLDLTDKLDIRPEISGEARTHLAKTGFNARYGARPLKGIIRNHLRRPLARKIISGEVKKGQTITIDIKDEIIVWK